MGWTDEIKNHREGETRRIEQYKESQDKAFETLTTMVTKLLDELGQAIHGKNTFFSQKYIVSTYKPIHIWYGIVDVGLYPTGIHDGFCFKVFKGHGDDYKECYTKTTSEEELKKAITDIFKI